MDILNNATFKPSLSTNYFNDNMSLDRNNRNNINFNNNNNNNSNDNNDNNNNNNNMRYKKTENLISSLYSEKLSSRRFKLLECSIESERTKEHSFSPKINENSDHLSYRKRIQRGNYLYDKKIIENNDNIYENKKNKFCYDDSDICNSNISKLNENSKNDFRSSEKSFNTSQVIFFSKL